MIFPNADPKKTAYLLNLNNQLNESDKENLTLNILDFDFNKPSGGGEIKTKQTYPFAVGQEIYIAIEEKKGFADYYRIYRFKALLFLVDRITISIEDNETIERYEAEKGKDLFSTGDAKPKTFITEKESIS